MFGPNIEEDPATFEEAAEKDVWRKAMDNDNEIESIERNNTWELTKLLKNAKRIGVKWIFKTKVNEQGEIDKHKARFVAKGYSQRRERKIKCIDSIWPFMVWNKHLGPGIWQDRATLHQRTVHQMSI